MEQRITRQRTFRSRRCKAKVFGVYFTSTNQLRMCITTVYCRLQFIKLVAQAISIGVHTEQLIKRYISVGILISHIIVTYSKFTFRIFTIFSLQWRTLYFAKPFPMCCCLFISLVLSTKYLVSSLSVLVMLFFTYILLSLDQGCVDLS